MKGKLSFVITLILLYLISTGISFTVFKNLKAGPQIATTPTEVDPGDGFKVDPGAPKTEVCPLNGKLYTKQERSIWEKRRPLGVMIENSTDARPHSGISKADVVYEAVAEGGITRFLAMFYCGLGEDTIIAPVRSARIYFFNWVQEYDSLYLHVGGAGVCSDNTVDPRAKVLCELTKYGGKDLDHIHNSEGLGFPTCLKNPDRTGNKVATEHQMTCQTDLVYKAAEARKFTNTDPKGKEWKDTFTPWKFKEEAKDTDRGTVAKIDLGWWKGYKDYDVTWNYDKATNEYKRVNGGVPHMDIETQQQLSAKNVVVQFTKETVGIDSHKHVLYETIGRGEALVFQDGQAIEATWSKKDKIARTIFTDKKGKEITFNPGVIWIEAIPTGNTVVY